MKNKIYKLDEYTVQKTVRESHIDPAKLSCRDTATKFAKSLYGQSIDVNESMYILTVDNRNIVTGYMKLSEGDRSATTMPWKKLYCFIASMMPAGVIVFHNHPSGQTKMSKSDKQVEDMLRKGLSTLGNIPLLDFFIVIPEYYE